MNRDRLDGKRLVIILLVTAVILAVVTYGLYLATRQLELDDRINRDNDATPTPTALAVEDSEQASKLMWG